MPNGKMTINIYIYKYNLTKMNSAIRRAYQTKPTMQNAIQRNQNRSQRMHNNIAKSTENFATN